MKIIGFNIHKILVEKKKDISEKFEMKSNLDIGDIRENKLPALKNQPTLTFDFVFTVDYNPDTAKVEIRGSVIALDEDGKSKEIIKEWKKNNIPIALKIPLFNFILNKCNLKAIPLEDEVGLPLHIPMPQISAEKKESKEAAPKEKPKYT